MKLWEVWHQLRQAPTRLSSCWTTLLLPKRNGTVLLTLPLMPQASALAEDESFTDEYRLSMGGWKSRDAMAAYAHHGAAKRAKASAMMSAKVSTPLPAVADVATASAVAKVADVPQAVVQADAPVAKPVVAASQHAVDSVAVCTSPPIASIVGAQSMAGPPPQVAKAGHGVVGSVSPSSLPVSPPPARPLCQSFSPMWSACGGQLSAQMSSMSQQMSAFQLHMQLAGIQMQVNYLQMNLLPKKE
ncbi:hypothetical protein V8C86DRAFT_2794676 [Haematococcus lacustris]